MLFLQLSKTSTNLMNQAGQNYATNAGNMITGGAAAQGAGQVGMANAVTGGLGTYLNYTQGNALLNALQNRGNSPSNADLERLINGG
jgi:flagellar basal body P-ring protein FlgI